MGVERRLRFREEQGTDLGAVFHSHTQLAHRLLCRAARTSAQVLHNPVVEPVLRPAGPGRLGAGTACEEARKSDFPHLSTA